MTALRRWLRACGIGVVVLAAAAPAAAELSCRILPQLVRAYLQNHVQYAKLTPELEQRTIDTYLRRLDPSRSMLTQADVEKLRASMSGTFEAMRNGDCSSLTRLHADFAARHRAAEALVRKTLGAKDYAIDESVSLVMDPEERGYPKTAAERDALQVDLIHFQMSNYLASGSDLADAKKKLIHRYVLRTHRFEKLTPSELYEAFLDAFAASLDPHSNYLSAEVLEDFRIGMTLSLEGIGVALSERDGYAVVERVIPGGAADRLHVLQPKDKLIAVAENGGEPVSIIDMPLRDAVAMIRGRKGTTVRLTVLRQGDKVERFPVSIVRDTINLEEGAASLRFEERGPEGAKVKLAILDLPSFYGDADPGKRQSTDDVANLLREVREQKADGLLLDLSRNGGGLLDHAVTISGFFLRRGEVVGIQGARGQRQILSDSDEGILYSGPMVLFTSRVSASAAEILAGALKDYKRAVIVGDDHTFGKGTVQTVSALPPGQGALKITTAIFFRPGGKSTQDSGVESDVVVPSALASDDFGEKFQPYSLSPRQTEPFLSSYANADPPSGRWRPVTPAIVAELRKRSHERIAHSAEFAELSKKVAEAKKNDRVVRISDILKEQERSHDGAKDADDPSGVLGVGAMTNVPEAGEAREKPSPQLEEAISVLADLVALSR